MNELPRRVIITTVPFGDLDPTPLTLLRDSGIAATINPIGRKLQASEVKDVIDGFPVVIAGTETIDAKTIAACRGLKAICRVGIGLDSVDLIAARKHGVTVSYTPDGPSPAVSELTIGLMIDLLRGVCESDRLLRKDNWNRITGRRLACSTVGIIGVGRIGRRLVGHLRGFPGVRILANDVSPDNSLEGVQWVDKETIYREADVISIHVPLTSDTLGMIGAKELAMMKPSAVLVNTARGGIVDESELASALANGTIRAAAIDVFVEEPYSGPLSLLPNAILTCHMGSMTADCRALMEIEATKEAIRFLTGEPLKSPVPPEEYRNAERMARG